MISLDINKSIILKSNWLKRFFIMFRWKSKSCYYKNINYKSNNLKKYISGLLNEYHTGYRTHTCGELSLKDEHKNIKLCGWIDGIRPFGPFTFVSLRDRYGITQIFFSKKDKNIFEKSLKLSLENVIAIEGKVRKRPYSQINKKHKTGEIEIEVYQLSDLNSDKIKNLPIQISTGTHLSNEESRMRYRYLDLRRNELQNRIIIRSKISMKVREYLCSHGFLDIETPTLFKSTPEGANEFLVPTKNKGLFYALTQSPQQYKQLLMVGGLDRYFQLARCYRDESGRADRQPEFTQIDLEISFIKCKYEIMNIIEGMIKEIWNKEHDILFPIMTYDEAMNRYGTDKPDIRYTFEIKKLEHVFHDETTSNYDDNLKLQCILKHSKTIRGINISKLNIDNDFSNTSIKKLQLYGKSVLTKGMEAPILVFRTNENGEIDTNAFSQNQKSLVKEILGSQKGDIVIITAGETDAALPLLGKMRQYCASILYKKGFLQNEMNKKNYKFLWVVDFPLFTMQDKEIHSTHHPFTAPKKDDSNKLENILNELESNPIHFEQEKIIKQLTNIKADHFDLVCNGWEVGGGSLRIHSATLQKRIFQTILHMSLEQQKLCFSHLLEALGSGCPPHGGIALGLDRLIAIYTCASSLHDVIAFPKSSTGRELMTDSPNKITTEKLKEYYINTIS